MDIQLSDLQRGWPERKLAVTLTDAARDYLANKGYDPAFGARPLKRLIQREIQDPLAMKLLAARSTTATRSRSTPASRVGTRVRTTDAPGLVHAPARGPILNVR